MRIAFASLGSLGDLHPLLAVARACGARGHETVVAASRGFGDYVEENGFAFRPIRPHLEPEPGRVEYLSHPSRGPGRLLREEIFGSVRETYHDLLEATEDADLLVVGELLYVAPLVAERRRIAWANAILSPASFLSVRDRGVLGPAPWLHRFGALPHRVALSIGRLVTARWAQPLTALRQELGHPAGPSPVYEGKFSPELVLALFPGFFAGPQSDWPGAVVQTGFPFFEQRGSEALHESIRAFLQGGAPPIVFTLGSSVVHIARDFYEHAAAAARRIGRRSVLLCGGNPVPEDLPDDALALSYAPLEWLFPGACLAVHHGGVGSCGEAIRAGVPSLAIPFGYDQPDNAERLERLGIGHVLAGRQFSAGRLSEALAAALADTQAASRARALAGELDPEADLGQTVDALERLLLRAG